MGKRSSLFKCHGCGHQFWEWFEWLTREEMGEFVEQTVCPECGSKDWELTDASRFSGGAIKTRSAELLAPDQMGED